MIEDILENVKKRIFRDVEINILVYIPLVTSLYLYSPICKHISFVPLTCKNTVGKLLFILMTYFVSPY